MTERWVPVRGDRTRSDDDWVGPDERRCASAARDLARVHVAMAVLLQVGVVLVGYSVSRSTNAAENALRGLGGRTDLALPTEPGWWTPTMLAGLAAIGMAVLGVASGFWLRAWLLARAKDGGLYGWRATAAVDPDGNLQRDARWQAILALESTGAGARPESVVRWARALRAAPPSELRPWLTSVREHLKDGQEAAVRATTADPAGGAASLEFAGARYEAAELASLCAEALAHLRDVLARVP
jgi:hypothetical protein